MTFKATGYILLAGAALFGTALSPASAQIFQRPGTFQAPGQTPVIPFPTAPTFSPSAQMSAPQVPQMSSPPSFELQNTTASSVGD